MRWVLKKVNSTYCRILKHGKLHKEFRGDTAYQDAQDYIAGCVKDDQWHASNRD